MPKLAPDIDAQTMQKLELYYSELIKFNRHLNLISRHTELDADVNHILDSVLGGRIVLANAKGATIHDIGSGNGAPGIVLSILDPKRKFVMVDSDERKCEFLKTIVSRLDLKNAAVQRGRFEDLPASSIQTAVSRGFASISKSLLLARKCFAPNGEYYHFKGSTWVREVAQIPSQLCTFWSPKLVAEYDLPVVTAKMAIVLTKRSG